MAIFVDQNTRLAVQGLTGREGRFHTAQCMAYGTHVVAGVTPGKGGQTTEGVPVFNTMAQAVNATGANCSLVFVPAPFAADAIMEAVDADVELIVAITEGVPIWDMMRVKAYMAGKRSRLIGPNCPGIITPGACKVGIMPGAIHKPGGPMGVISRSGTLTYEVVHQLTRLGIGQSTCIGIGGDSLVGTSFIDCLEAFEHDPETKAVLLVGEIGGRAEEDAAAFIADSFTKPVAGFVAGKTAPPGRRMGHAGAIVGGSKETAQAKITALAKAGIHICGDLSVVGEVCRNLLK